MIFVVTSNSWQCRFLSVYLFFLKWKVQKIVIVLIIMKSVIEVIMNLINEEAEWKEICYSLVENIRSIRCWMVKRYFFLSNFLGLIIKNFAVGYLLLTKYVGFMVGLTIQLLLMFWNMIGTSQLIFILRIHFFKVKKKKLITYICQNNFVFLFPFCRANSRRRSVTKRTIKINKTS